MKIDGKALAAGAALLAAVPLLLLYQSSNTSKGTSRGWSEYNVDQAVSGLNEHLRREYGGQQPDPLDMFCDYVIDRDRNAVYAATWIDHAASRRGECAAVHLARGRLAILRGGDGKREFAAARAAAANDEERAAVEKTISEHGR